MNDRRARGKIHGMQTWKVWVENVEVRAPPDAAENDNAVDLSDVDRAVAMSGRRRLALCLFGKIGPYLSCCSKA